jgi:excisionase family DNA binding protein
VEESHDGYDDRVKAAMAAMRRKTRMTQEAFARALSEEVGDGRQIRGHWISRWESGDYMPKSDVFLASMAVSGADPREIGVNPRATAAIRINDLERQLRNEATGPMSDYLTVEAAAAHLGVGGRSMYSYIRKGEIPGYKWGGYRTVFRKKDVEALAKRRRPK